MPSAHCADLCLTQHARIHTTRAVTSLPGAVNRVLDFFPFTQSAFSVKEHLFNGKRRMGSNSSNANIFRKQICQTVSGENLWFCNSALCYCTAELLSSRGRPSSNVCRRRRRPFVDITFLETVKWIHTKFWWQISTISPEHFLFQNFISLFFLRFFFVFFNMGPYGRKIKFSKNIFSESIVMGRYSFE